jgi:hypothetical protein
MDFGRAITFPFEDHEWPVKVIVGALLSLIPFFAPGYLVRVTRNMIRGRSHPLPTTDELGQVFIDGLMAGLAALIYFLPLIIIGCLLVFPAMLSGQDDVFAVMFCASMVCVLSMALLYAIPVSGLYVMGVIRYAETGNFSAFMQFGALWRDLMDNLSLMITLLFYVVVLVAVTLFVSPILAPTIVGAPLLVFWYHVATGHLIGQVGLQLRGE